MTKFLRVRVLGHDVRVTVRPGTAPGPPLVLCNGIGASLDLLQPFVDEVDPRIEVVRFDVPGVGGSPAPKVPYNFATLAWLVGTLVDRQLLGASRSGEKGEQRDQVAKHGDAIARAPALAPPRPGASLATGSSGGTMKPLIALAAFAALGCAPIEDIADAAPAGTLLVGNKGENMLSFIDLASGRELGRAPTGNMPHEIAISPNGRQAAVVAYGETTGWQAPIDRDMLRGFLERARATFRDRFADPVNDFREVVFASGTKP